MLGDPIHDLIYGLFVFGLGRCRHFCQPLLNATNTQQTIVSAYQTICRGGMFVKMVEFLDYLR